MEGVGAPALSRRGLGWPPAQAANTTPIERDPQLFEKLKAEEWPGILSWMIQGYLEWKRSGLQPPDIVRNASEAYFQAEDSIATWIDEHCRLDRRLGNQLPNCTLAGLPERPKQASRQGRKRTSFRTSKREVIDPIAPTPAAASTGSRSSEGRPCHLCHFVLYRPFVRAYR